MTRASSVAGLTLLLWLDAPAPCRAQEPEASPGDELVEPAPEEPASASQQETPTTETLPPQPETSPLPDALPPLPESFELPALPAASAPRQHWLSHSIGLTSSIWPGQRPEGVDSLLEALAWILGISLISALLATRSARRDAPLALLRPLMTRATAREHAPAAAFARLPFAWRLGLRNLLRSPRLTATSVLGVALTVSVGAAYLVCLDSMRHTVHESLGQQQWERAVSFAYPVLDEDYLALAQGFGGLRLEPFVRARATLQAGGDTQDVSLLGIDPAHSLRGIQLKQGRLAAGPDEVVLGADLVKRLRTQLDAQVELRLRDERRTMRVVGIKTDVTLGEAVMALEPLRRLTELEDQASGVFLRVADRAQLPELDRSLGRRDFVAKVVHHDSLTSKFMLILADIRKLVLLVAAVALLVGVVFIAANLGMTMQDRSTELSTLWALGCDRGTALRAIAVEVALQTLLGLLLAVPLGWALASFINRLWSAAWFEQSTFVAPSLVGTIAAGVAALTSLAAVWTFARCWRPSMLENLRARGLQ